MKKTWFDRSSAVNDEFDKDSLFTLLEETNANVFITGPAGTGKSTILRKFVALTKKKCVVLAPTGIAATNVEGQTIHSFFRLPPAIITEEDVAKNFPLRIYRKMNCLIIDEISMVRRDVFDAMDQILRKHRSENEPFGGVQLLLFGDMLQLPPVTPDEKGNEIRSILRKKYGTDNNYFFDSKAYPELELQVICLHKVHRQTDERFIEILTHMQEDMLTPEDLSILNSRVREGEVEDDHIILSTVNSFVDSHNQTRLDRLPGTPKTYTAEIEGDIGNEKSAIWVKHLTLKGGARIMFITNDRSQDFFNGSLGTVMELLDDSVKVKLDSNGACIVLRKHEWEILEHAYERGEITRRKKGSVKQIPLKLAWAMTVHKSQGQTLEKVTIDFRYRPWEPGQAYVAFSRIRNLEGLVLKKPLQKDDIFIDQHIKRWETELKREQERDSPQKLL